MKTLIIFISLLLSSPVYADDKIERWEEKPQTDLYANKIGTFFENMTLKDSSGKAQKLYSAEAPLTVITIFDIDCPISLKLVPKIQRLEKEFPKVAFRHVFIRSRYMAGTGAAVRLIKD